MKNDSWTIRREKLAPGKKLSIPTKFKNNIFLSEESWDGNCFLHVKNIFVLRLSSELFFRTNISASNYMLKVNNICTRKI